MRAGKRAITSELLRDIFYLFAKRRAAVFRSVNAMVGQSATGAEPAWRVSSNNGPLTSGAFTSIMAHFPAVSLPSL